MRESTAAIVASVVETTGRPGRSSSTTLSRPSANFWRQTCVAGLAKHLSSYTGRSCQSEWHLRIALSLFAHRKRISWTRSCSLGDTFNGNVAVFNVYKWRHSDVIVIKLRWYLELNSIQSIYFEVLVFWKLIEWRHLWVSDGSTFVLGRITVRT